MRRVNHVIRSREKHPEWTLGYIAKKVGTSRENVWQILNRRGMPTAAIRPNPEDRPPKVRRRRCRVCRKILINPISRGKVPPLCKGSCYFQWYYVKIRCEWCNVVFYRRKSVIKHRALVGKKHTYCTVSCYKNRKRVHSGDKRHVSNAMGT